MFPKKEYSVKIKLELKLLNKKNLDIRIFEMNKDIIVII